MRRYGRREKGIFIPVLVWTAAGLLALCALVYFIDSGTAGEKRNSEGKITSVPKAASSASFRGGLQPITDWKLILVNFQHRMPENYNPELTTAFGVEMDERIVEPFREMKNAASKDGITLYASSGYRSSEKQEQLFKQEVESYSKVYSSREIAEAFAEKSVAKPGYSEHNTGLALDLNGVREDFGRTPEYRWLTDHAEDYGFVLRYPEDKQNITQIKFEPWHYRYVGVENARKMKKLGLCLEEYREYLQKTGSAN